MAGVDLCHDNLDAFVWRETNANVGPRTHLWLTEQIHRFK